MEETVPPEPTPKEPTPARSSPPLPKWEGEESGKAGAAPSFPDSSSSRFGGSTGEAGEGDSSEETTEPTDPAVVSSWLLRIKPAAVLALLKDPDLSAPVSSAFLGFRPDAKGYANPLVRRRLALLCIKDERLTDKLRTLAEHEPLTPIVAAKPAPALPRPSLSTAEPKPDSSDVLRAERDQRRRERDDARHALARAEEERDEAVRGRQKAEAERDEAGRTARQKTDRISRLKRQVTQLRQAETYLLRALSQDKVSPPPSTPARAAGPLPAGTQGGTSPWLTAVRHLLDKGKFEQALALAEDVLRADPEEASALDMTARAWEGKRETRQAAFFVRRLLALQLIRRETPDATESLLNLLRLLPDPTEAEADVRAYLAALSPSDGAALEAARRMLARLRGLAPDAHVWLTEYISAKSSLGPVLMPPPGALGLDDPLPLKLNLGQTVTARQLSEAVDRGNVALVDAARTALQNIDPETSRRLWTALEQATDEDATRLLPLRRTPRGPIVVDGSNVAWFDQESLVNGRPRLRHLRAMRRALRARGFFPVVLYADANLPYSIDEPAPLRAMRDSRELTLVDAGTVADEVLLRTAKHLGAPLVTNDKMEDWDPESEVTKIRYTISHGGEALFLSVL